jgi:hypothetical protein
MSDETNRRGSVAGCDGKLSVHHNHLSEGVEHLGKSAQALDQRMINAGDHPIAEGDPH